MLAGTLLILESWTGAIRRDSTLHMNSVSMLFWLLVRAIHDFDIAFSEWCELEALPRGSLFYRGIGIQHFEDLGRVQFSRHR
jgi:hypothetical protein